MQTFKKILDHAVNAAAWIAGLATVLMMLHVTADVIARNLFNAPLTGTLEIVSTYHMAALSFLPLAYIAREKGHIVVEIFTNWLRPSPRAILDKIVALITVAYMAIFSWKALETALAKTAIRDAKEAGFGLIEVWPARWFVFIGFVLMGLYVLYHLIADLRRKDRS